MIEFSEKDGAIVLSVRVAPRASRSEIAGAHDNALKIRIAAAPVEGAANAELIRVLAEFFEVPKSAVEIIGGKTSKLKRVRIESANGEKLKRI